MRWFLSVVLITILSTARADAAPPNVPIGTAPPVAESPSVQQARELFKNGTDLAKRTEWSEALRAFEESAKLRRHAITTYNIAVCERAIGRYTRARAMLKQALADSAANKGELPDSLTAEANAYLSEIEGLLVQLDATIDPADAALAIDGRPVTVEGTTTPPTVVAGIAAAGRGEPLATPHVTIVLDPGTHLFALSRKGFSDVVVNKTFRPAERVTLTLGAEQLPATLHVTSNYTGAAVSLNGVDVGATPVDVVRPGGLYSLLVRKDGYVAYNTDVHAEPGADLRLNAVLDPEKTPITKRWWFWSGVAAVVIGAVVVTYFVTRPAPERPPVDGGGLGWALKTP
jgi:hypothetical protein